MNSKDCRVPLPSERHALPTPSPFRRTEALDDIESDDCLKIRAALARIDTEIEAKALLDQLDKPERPKWQIMLNDCFSENTTSSLQRVGSKTPKMGAFVLRIQSFYRADVDQVHDVKNAQRCSEQLSRTSC